ncbi:retention module-containing protein [Photobacterium damselae]|uniref:retention module-containing protein n=1 Tax=Photobacterium damselae TaxID=38293 RepID=UPI0012AE4871|nr:retention module-containing protein [Photobacterium damselae]
MFRVEVDKPIIVVGVNGNAYSYDGRGKLEPVIDGQILYPGEVVITADNANISVLVGHDFYVIEPHSVAAIIAQSNSPNLFVDLTGIGFTLPFDVLIENEALNEAPKINLDIQKFFNLVLEGKDPTQAFTPPDAGSDSSVNISEHAANTGDVEIQYDNIQLLAEAGFDTHYQPQAQAFDDDPEVYFPSEGGESGAIELTEGDLEPKTYPITASTILLVDAGSLPLNPESVQFAPESRGQLLNLLNQTITSSQQKVIFSYDTDFQSLVGKVDGNEVIRFVLSATQANNGIDANVTLTINQQMPIDHRDEIDSSIISITDQQLRILFDIEVYDVGNNAPLNSLTIEGIINDGVLPNVSSDSTVRIEESLTAHSVSGVTHIDIGSDNIASIAFSELQPSLVGITSEGLATQYQVEGNRVALSYVDHPDTLILTVELQTSGDYVVTSYFPVDQSETLADLILPLNYFVTDFDGDNSNIGTITVIIEDSNAPPGGNTGDIVLTEGDLDSAVVAEQYPVSNQSSFVIDAGFDRLLANTLHFVESDLNSLLDELNLLTSAGQSLQFSVVELPSGQLTLTGLLETGQPALKLVLTPSQSDILNITVNVSIEQNIPIDELPAGLGTQHLTMNGELLNFSLSLQATTTDGDVLQKPARLDVTIQDGMAPQLAASSSISITDPLDNSTQPVRGDGSLAIDLGSDTLKTLDFLPQQSSLDGLLSNSLPTYYEVVANKLSLKVEGSQQIVLTVEIDLDGRYTVNQYLPLNQPTDTNLEQLILSVQATDFDDDQSNIGELVIDILDGNDPVLQDGAQTLITETLATQTVTGQINVIVGSDKIDHANFLLDQASLQGLTSNGHQTDFRVSGNVLTVYIPATATTAEQTVFDVTLAIDGSYSLTQYHPIDQDPTTNLTELSLDVTVTDKDDDTSNIGHLLIGILDGINPDGQGLIAQAVNQEGDLDPMTYPTQGQGSVTIPALNDDLVSDSVIIDSGQVALLVTELEQLTASGLALTFTVSSISSPYSVLLTGVNSQNQTVLTVTLTPTAVSTSGGGLGVELTVAAEQHLPLDHDPNVYAGGQYVQVTDDAITIDIPVQCHDSDDDFLDVPATAQVILQDGEPPSIVGRNIAWTESYDPQNPQVQEITGQLTVDTNSDQIKTVEFNDPQNAFAGLTSNGQATEVLFDASHPNQMTLVLLGTTTPVLSLEIADDGRYVIKQYLPLDEPAGSNKIHIDLAVDVIDFDGDRSKASTLSLEITDGENPDGTTGDMMVVEGDLVPPEIGPSTQQYPVQIEKKWVLLATDDDLVASSLAIDTSLKNQIIQELEQLTSQGDALSVTFIQDSATREMTWQANAVSTSQLVFALTITPTQDNSNVQVLYHLEQHLPLDHLPYSGSYVTANGTEIAFDMPLQLFDTDGDPLAHPLDITVRIDDGDIPHFAPGGGTQLTEIGSTTGSAGLNVGSDEIAKLIFLSDQPSLQGLLSNGEATYFTVTDNELALKVVGSDANVLTVTIDKAGTYQVDQFLPLNQPTVTDLISLSLQVQATDFDNDQSNIGELVIDILDGNDPVLQDGAQTLITETLATQTVTGQINVIVGSDKIDHANFLLDQASLQGLTSNGHQTDFRVSGNVLTVYIPATATTAEQTVFDVTLTIDGSYSLTQYHPIDQDPTTNLTELSLDVTVTDKDDDTSNVGHLLIGILDGINPDGQGLIAQAVNQEGDLDPMTYPTQGQGSVTIPALNDDLVPDSVVIDSRQVALLVTELEQLTASGLALTFTVSSISSPYSVLLTGVDSQNQTVLTVTLTPTAVSTSGGGLGVELTVAAEQHLPLDHDPNVYAGGQYVQVTDDAITIDIPVQCHDSDDDFLDVPATAQVILQDGEPPSIVGRNIAWTESYDPQNPQVQEITGQLTVNTNSDQIKTVEFNDPQNAFAGLTSNSQATEVLFDASHPNQMTLVLLGTTTPVLSLEITDDGRYIIKQYLPLDEPAGSNKIHIDLAVDVIDFDGDRSKASTISLEITDGENPDGTTGDMMVVEGDLVPPEIGPSTQQYPVQIEKKWVLLATDDDLVASSLAIDASLKNQIIQELEQLTSQGDALSVTFTQDSATGEMTWQANAVTTSQLVFAITITPTQDNSNVQVLYHLEQHLPLDHLPYSGSYVTANGTEIAFDMPLQLFDTDGDPLAHPLDITVRIDDGDIPQFTTDPGTTLVEVGTADGAIGLNIGSDVIASLVFATKQPSLDGLTSHGYSTQYQVVDNQLTLVRKDNPSITVLTVTVQTDGSYQIVQTQPLDQTNTSDTTELSLAVIATDKDDDVTVTDGLLQIIISDGTDSDGSVTGDQSLDITEGSLSETRGSIDGYPVSDTAQLTVSAGIDRLEPNSITIASSQLASLLNELTNDVTSNGQILSYHYDAATSTLIGSLGTETYLELVLTATNSVNGLDADVSVTVRQYQPLNHNQTADSSGFVSVNGEQIVIDLQLQIQDTDQDWLTNAIPVSVTINDGVFPQIISTEPLKVEESDIDSGGANHQGSTPNQPEQTASGIVAVKEGSDAVINYLFDTKQFSSDNTHIKSQGEPVLLQDLGSGQYQGVAGGRVIFTVSLSTLGHYQFTLLGAIDHPLQGADELTVRLPVQAVDADNDLSAHVTLPVTIVDDLPNGENISFSITEGDSATNQQDVLSVAGEGADGAKVVAIIDLNQEHALTSSGINYFDIHDDTGQLLGSLAIQATGEVSFESEPHIKHIDEVLTHVVQYRVTDGDGDTELRNITLNISDQDPVVIVTSPVIAYEDEGRHPDPDESLLNPALGEPINVQISIGDDDRGEFIDTALIPIPATVHGIFYYNGSPLALSSDGLSYVVPPSAFISSDGVNYQLVGVSFIPNADFSTINGDLNYDIAITVGTTSGAAQDHPTQTASFTITVEGIADVPTWDDAQTITHYTVAEDDANVALQLKANLNDTDGSETLSYIITMVPDSNGNINGVLEGTGISDLGNNQYKIAAKHIHSVTVNPNDQFSGDIKLEVVAESKEKHVYVSGQRTADSIVKEIVINVEPIADATTLKVTRVESLEDELIALSGHITLANTIDTDGSETLYLRFSDLPIDGELLLNGVEVTELTPGSGVYEILYSELRNAFLKPTPESNLDFSFTVQGVVKDDATLTDPSGLLNPAQDIFITPAKPIEVALKGVSDIPNVVIDIDPNGNGVLDIGEWAFIDNTPDKGIETLILEDTTATLDFDVITGEIPLRQPIDHSESLSMVIYDIPVGVTLRDKTGDSTSLVYAGVDSHGNPMYEVSIASLANIEVVPPQHSTEDIPLKARVVVTEDDGDVKTFERDILINIAPVIDAGDYSITTSGHAFEDQNNTVNWKPGTAQGFVDNQEHIVGIQFKDVPSDYQLLIDGSPLSLVSGAVTLTPLQVNALQSGSLLQIRAPDNSDRDVTFHSILTIEQTDNDGEPTATKEITGTLTVDIQAVVEPDGELQVTDNGTVITNITSTTDGVIDLSTGAQSQGQLSFSKALDSTVIENQSHEVIYEVVIDFPDTATDGTPINDDFVVIGGTNDGKGDWTVTASELSNLKIIAPNGFDKIVDVTIWAEVQDLGDNGEGDVSNLVVFNDTITLDFSPNTSTSSDMAGDISTDPIDFVITGDEDKTVNLGDQLDDYLVIGANDHDQANDVLSIVIAGSDLPAGTTVSGMKFDFVKNEYVFSANVLDNGTTGTVDLSLITFKLPEDYAGDFQFNARIVTTDKNSGDTELKDLPVTVRIAPIVDVPPAGAPSLDIGVVETQGLDSDKFPTDETGKPEVIIPNQAYEDGIIQLDLSSSLADISTSTAEGLETMTQAVLTVDITKGAFLQDDGSGNLSEVQIITVPSAGFGDILFKPHQDYSGSVDISVAATIEDNVDYTLTSPPTAQDIGTVNATVSFDIIPVNDQVVFTGDQAVISGNEDQTNGISLGSIGFSMEDIDGSETIVSVKLTDIPDGFTLTAPAQNLGGGEWSIAIPSGQQTGTLAGVSLVPPKDFSGTLDINLTVYTKEDLLPDVKEQSTQLNINIEPIADRVDSDITTEYQGKENSPIDISLKLQARDDSDSVVPPVGNVIENPPETLLIVVTNVPDSSTFDAPNNGSAVKQGDGSWVITVASSDLDDLVFNPVDANGEIVLDFNIRAVDNGVPAVDALAINQPITLHITPENDAPINTVPSSPLSVNEDTPLLINSLRISDVDANEGTGNMRVTLSAQSGTISIVNSSGVSVTGDGSASITIEGSLDAINAALTQGINYQGDLDFNGLDTITMTTNDNGNTGDPGPLEDIDSFQIEVKPINDPPVNHYPTALTTDENAALSITGLSISDPDSGSGLMTVQLTVSQGIISLASQAGVSIVGNDSTKVTLSGSLTDINLLFSQVDGVQYTPDNHYFGNDALVMTTNDNGNLGDPGPLSDTDTIPITITPINDPPVLTVPSTLTVDEDISTQVVGLSVDDIDAGSGALIMTLRADHGVLFVPASSGVTITQLSGGIQLEGELTALNQALAQVEYTADTDYFGTDTITVFVDDQGNTGASSETDTKTIPVIIQAKPDIPTISFTTPQTAVIQSSVGVLIPLLGIMAAVANPVSDELSILVSGLNGASIVNSQGSPIGTPISMDVIEVPASQLDQLHVKDLPQGSSQLMITAQSSVNGETEQSLDNLTLDVHLQPTSDPTIDASASTAVDGNLVVDGSGDKTLVGSDQNDILQAGAGNDVLRGGLGNDILTGGEGDDAFDWQLADLSGFIDTVTDFELGVDSIDIADILDDPNGDGVTLDDLLANVVADASNGEVVMDVTATNGQSQQIELENIQAADLGLTGSASSADLLTAMFNQQVFSDS